MESIHWVTVYRLLKIAVISNDCNNLFFRIRIYQEITGVEIDNPLLHFGVVWIGIMNSFWKLIIMSGMSPQFRLALRIFFLTICCRTNGRQAEILGLDPDD